MSLIDEGFVPYTPNQEGQEDVQDPSDPVWESVLPDFHNDPSRPENMHELGESEPVRVNSNLLDFGTFVSDEDPNAWIGRETEHGQGHRQRGPKPAACPVDVKVMSATDFRVQTYQVGGALGSSNNAAVKVCQPRADRRRVVINNQSAAVLWFSHSSTPVVAGNSGAIPVGGSREIFSHSEVWVAANTPGTAQLFDVQEEYYLDGRED